MAEWRWHEPRLIGRFEFAESAADDHLRHPRFFALGDAKDPRTVVGEQP